MSQLDLWNLTATLWRNLDWEIGEQLQKCCGEGGGRGLSDTSTHRFSTIWLNNRLFCPLLLLSECWWWWLGGGNTKCENSHPDVMIRWNIWDETFYVASCRTFGGAAVVTRFECQRVRVRPLLSIKTRNKHNSGSFLPRGRKRMFRNSFLLECPPWRAVRFPFHSLYCPP